MSDVKSTAARQSQSQAAKKATLALLRGKKRRTRTLTVTVDGEELTLTFQALGADALDKLRADHPPTTKQRAAGQGVNTDTFAPALVAACLQDPVMSFEEARELWESPEWSAGELNQLFETASQLCLEGMDIPFSVSD